jgi:uncharacterized protein with beta-barrel porin domain
VVVVAAPASADGGNGGAFPGGAGGMGFTGADGNAIDAAVVGLQATTVAAATQVYLRYDGGVGGGTDNHALNVGLRMSW